MIHDTVDIDDRTLTKLNEEGDEPYYPILEPEPNLMGNEKTSNRISSIISEYEDYLIHRKAHHLGYPYNLDFDFSQLDHINKFSINNLGDPFIASNYGIHSRKFEIGVLKWFAKLWEIDEKDMWGYITNCGTEGNLHGILTGREILPDGILYCSKATHYSVPKASHMYRMEICLVDVLEGDEINCDHLKECLSNGKKRGKPAIINVNIGTTVTGAVDSLKDVHRVLNELEYKREDYYIHLDGALFGMMAPFVTKTTNNVDDEIRISFSNDIDSVSVSGHKFIGTPVPCGVIISRRKHIDKLSKDIEYLNSKDTTIMGSRNGHAALYLWYAIQMKGISGFKKDVYDCLERAKYLKDTLITYGVNATLGKYSSTVVFDRPSDIKFIKKWQLACQGDIAHVVIMPSTSLDVLNIFISEYTNIRIK
jgi:histidine decarboxylase